jgi:anti-sigma factor RsiW
MKITRDIIKDLLPTYFSGEASADTRSLVEEYLRQDPAFEREARSAAQTLQSLGEIGTPPFDSTTEKTALKSAKRILRRQKILLALASTFTLNAITLSFSFEIGDGRFRIHWLTLPGQREFIVVILLISAAFWMLYVRTSRRVRTRVLG